MKGKAVKNRASRPTRTFKCTATTVTLTKVLHLYGFLGLHEPAEGLLEIRDVLLLLGARQRCGPLPCPAPRRCTERGLGVRLALTAVALHGQNSILFKMW
jgi:hypothetical protein